jgi:hypothetical protein
MSKSLLGLTLVAALGCADKNIEIARQLVQPDPAGGEPTVFTVAGCQAYDGMVMHRTCVVDSDGKTYGLGDGPLPVISATPPYGVYFLFDDDATPLAQDISTEGEQASVKVYAAVSSIMIECAPESSEANRIAARASLTPEGGLLVTVHEALVPGTQVAVILEYGALFRSRVAPPDGGACTLPGSPVNLCLTADPLGFAERFYVGAEPAAKATSPGTAIRCSGQ